jgi:YYY domain-containing protein
LVFVNLADGGLAAGRVLAIALFSLLAMWLAVLRVAPLSLAPLWFAGLPLLGSATLLAPAGRRAEFISWLRQRLPALLFSELVFFAGFVFFLWIRLRHPEINDLEKPMDSAIMGVLTHAGFLPADNPWWSGLKFTNYYYFGHLMGALLARCFGTPIAFAYNLVLPTFSALFIAALWSLCAAVTDSRWRGLAATAMVGLLGHFEPLRQMVNTGQVWPLNWWDTSRVIKDTINEYPMFTMTIGDAHAHFFALALAALTFCLCWELYGAVAPAEKPNRRHAVLILLGVVLGILIMTNTWDAPTYGALTALCALLTMRRRQPGWQRELAWCLLPLPLALPVAWPYLKTFHAQIGGVQRELWSPSAVSFYLLWAGFFTLFLMVMWLLDTGRRWRAHLVAAAAAIPLAELLRWLILKLAGQVEPLRQAGERLDLVTLPVVAAAVLLAAGWFAQNRALLQVPAGPPALAEPQSPTTHPEADGQRIGFIFLLGLIGLLALLAPMMFYLRGVFGDSDLRHQDTMFKYTLQAWLLMGTAASCGGLYLWGLPTLARWRIPAAVACGVLWIVPLLCAACVVDSRAVGGASVLVDQRVQLSLDGARHVAPDDRAAIAWLAAHGREGDIVMEGVGTTYNFSGYNEFGRVAALSGMPCTLGWTQHVAGWNSGLDLKGRWDIVIHVYQWPDTTTAMAELNSLNVKYIFIGSLELRDYDPKALQRMRAALPAAFEQGQTVVLQAR